MKHYDVNEAFDLLKANKITTQKESVRRWLRQGTIQGITPASRKEGWLIREDDLNTFISSRLPNDNNTTSDAKEAIRAEMWGEIVNKHIFENFIEPKRKQVKACIEHLGLSKDFEQYAWKRVSKHTRGHRAPRIPYLLDAFLFEGKRIRFNENYEALEEQILYALVEHLRQEKVYASQTSKKAEHN